MPKLSRIQKILLLISVFVVILGVVIYSLHVWFTMHYMVGRDKVPAEMLEVDRNFSFPKNFPPDPGDSGKKTIQGIDTDHDGVRDDVQRWIYAFLPREPKKQMALRQLARYFQDSLADDFSVERRKVNHTVLRRAIQCKTENFEEDELWGYVEMQYIRAKMLNTYERTARYLENDRKYTVEEMSGVWPKEQNPCDNR